MSNRTMRQALLICREVLTSPPVLNPEATLRIIDGALAQDAGCEATPQMQATHGEGEATLGCPKCGYSMTPIFVSDDYMDAPSPTAAPALGELAKRLIARAKASAYLGNPHTEDADLMLEAAAALSGVAAQGDTKA